MTETIETALFDILERIRVGGVEHGTRAERLAAFRDEVDLVDACMTEPDARPEDDGPAAA